ncbi:GGDEF domain-containing protein [Fictibacillus iocasae]|uniref:GGDEF domain-containing protein n=1 Tax=Fictibacillus iocasae TaxID=2715437 RepID=A0ABW2NUN1_9BACL
MAREKYWQELRKKLYTKHVDAIPTMIDHHLGELKTAKYFNLFLTSSLTPYEHTVQKMLHANCRGVFLPERRYKGFLKKSEESAFQSGIQFVKHQKIPYRSLGCFTKSIRNAVLLEVKKVLSDEEMEVQLHVLERWNEISHHSLTGFLSGFCSQQFMDLKEISIRDPLTNLYNRRYFYDCLDDRINESACMEQPLTLLMLDVNNFKYVNDEFGHNKGDELLCHIAWLAQEQSLDYGFRFGGDEFVFLLPGATEQEAYETAVKIEKRLSNWKKYVSLAYGAIELKPDAGERIDDYLHLADKRMYDSKKSIKR